MRSFCRSNSLSRSAGAVGSRQLLGASDELIRCGAPPLHVGGTAELLWRVSLPV
jgi:hypothetical protein